MAKAKYVVRGTFNGKRQTVKHKFLSKKNAQSSITLFKMLTTPADRKGVKNLRVAKAPKNMKIKKKR